MSDTTGPARPSTYSAAPISRPPLIEGLLAPGAYPHPVERVEIIETHISWVLLAGAFAYKVKKPVALGFLNFSTLERRRFFCDEEVRLNRRLAPDLYLGVVQVRGTPGRPYVGGQGPVLEHAVLMRRFPQRCLLINRPLSDAIVERVADRVATFHAAVATAAPDSQYGAPLAVLAPMLDNFAEIGASQLDASSRCAARRLECWTRGRFERLRTRLEQRRRDGHIRECHGDMHRGNIAILDDGQLIIFDGIEFNPSLRWMDTMSELAFLAMDLRASGEEALARRLVSRYLERTGDYAGIALLRLYQVYRAMVRAKVVAIRLSQPSLDRAERQREQEAFRRYLRLGRSITLRSRPHLFITHGLSGSGKTWIGTALREHLPLIHLRSDVERKRLFGLSPDAHVTVQHNAGIYSPEATRRTYDHLLALAKEILRADYSVLVDATFLRREQRAAAWRLARELGCRITMLALDAPTELLRQRVRERQAAGADASDADEGILDAQIAAREVLGADELHWTIRLDTARPQPVAALLRRLDER